MKKNNLMKIIYSSLLFILVASFNFANAKAEEKIIGKKLDVLGSKMFYRTGGNGDVVLFLHGIPDSSYTFRKVLPEIAKHARVIAPDLIGMGKSGKPDYLEYRINDHIRYLEAFIDILGLTNITLVVTDIGSSFGFDYAARHPENIKAIAFYEAIIGPPPSLDAFPPETVLMRDVEQGWNRVVKENWMLEVMLPQMTVIPLSEEILSAYKTPFQRPGARRSMLGFLRDMPVDGFPADNWQTFTNYSNYLYGSDVPKLFIYASPGMINPPEMLPFVEFMPNIETTYIGEGRHLLTEELPNEFVTAFLDWYSGL